MTVRFYVKRNQLYCRIRLKGLVTFATGLYIDNSKWDQLNQIVIGRDPNNTNAELFKIKSKCREILDNYDSKGISIDASKIRGKLLKRSEALLISELIAKVSELKSNELSKGTMAHYSNLKNKIMEYNDILAVDISNEYCYNLFIHFKQELNISQNHCHFLICNKLKSVYNFAKSHNLIATNPIVDFSLKKEKKEIVFLTKEELLTIHKKQFGERLTEIRDIFLFQCYTGMEYSRVKNLHIDQLGKSIHYGEIINTRRSKTSNTGIIPILPEAKAILVKYSNHSCRENGYLLPVRSNQKMNEYLKEIQNICNIKKKLHTHLARHTFATIAINNEVPMHIIADVMGITDMSTLSRYYSIILKPTVAKEMKKLKFIA